MPRPGRRAIAILCLIVLGAPLLPPSRAQAEDGLVQVAIDATAIADRDFRALAILQLQRKLALRLTQEGYAVVAVSRRPTVVVMLDALEDAITIHVRSARHVALRRVERRGIALEDLHLEVLHKAVEAIRDLLAQVRRDQPIVAAGDSERAPLTTAARPEPTPPVDRLVAGVAAAGVFGGDPVAFRLRADVRYRIWSRLGLRLAGLFSPSSASAPATSANLSVSEWGLQAGASWRQPLWRTVHLEIGAMAGFLHHSFRFGGDAATPDNGSQLVGIGGVLVELAWFLHPRVAVRPYLGPQLAQPRRHDLASTPQLALVLWESKIFQLEGGVWVTVGLL